MSLARLAPTVLAATLALALGACATTPPAVGTADAEATLPADTSPGSPDGTPDNIVPERMASPAANDNLNAVAWVQTSAEYRLLAMQAWRAGTEELERALATPGWDALVPSERANPPTGLPPAVIVDIDETVLDNSPYQARLVRDGGSYDEATWDVWVREERAAAVPGALAFAKAAAARGVTIYYVSNRAVHLEEATLRNLRALGFPLEKPEQFLGLGTVVDGCESEGSEKGCRRQLVGRTHRVLMQFGDQIGDFATIVANTRAGRDEAMAPHAAWIGERWFLLPNPTYGSWEPALFDNAWSLPAEERRARKIQALDFDGTAQ